MKRNIGTHILQQFYKLKRRIRFARTARKQAHTANIAPPEELIYHLALFKRMFSAIMEFGEADDKSGMILGGWLADALHNAPGMLYRFEPQPSWSDDCLEEYSLYVRQNAPVYLANRFDAIISRDGIKETLCLRDDLSDLSVAPALKMYRYLSILYRTCLSIRLISNYADGREFIVNTSRWNSRADEMAAYCRQVSISLCNLPEGLLHWDKFNERQFWKDIRRARHGLSAINRQNWDYGFEPGHCKS